MGWIIDALLGRQSTGSQQGGTPSSTPGTDEYHQATGAKIIPEIAVIRVETHCSSDMSHMDLWLQWKNISALDIEFTRVDILGQSADPNRFLKAGQADDYCAYKGATPTNDAAHTARITYKISSNGDYFEADYQILYHLEQTPHGRFFLPDELRLIRPIRDRF